MAYFFPVLDRLFHDNYQPTEQDIVLCRARTIGITETTFQLKDHEMLMVDVGGQKSERRKWIHCFQDVTSILFLVSLSGYDQCLVEDRDAVRDLSLVSFHTHTFSQNQMQDAMTIWDSICHSQWFKQTSIVRAHVHFQGPSHQPMLRSYSSTRMIYSERRLLILILKTSSR